MLEKEDIQVLEKMFSNFRDELKEDISNVRDELKGDISTTRNEIMAYIENTTNKEIKAVAEGHSILNDKLNAIANGREGILRLEERVTNLEIEAKKAKIKQA